MHPIAHIRNEVLKLTQAAFAEVAGVTQPTVSRWESGEFPPTLTELSRIREAVKGRGLEWDDKLFFEVPPKVETEGAAA